MVGYVLGAILKGMSDYNTNGTQDSDMMNNANNPANTGSAQEAFNQSQQGQQPYDQQYTQPYMQPGQQQTQGFNNYGQPASADYTQGGNAAGQTYQQQPYGQPNTGQPGYAQTNYTQTDYTYSQQTGPGQTYTYTQTNYTPAANPGVPYGYVPRQKLVAGLLGIFLGAFGVHNFYLGNTGKAVAQLLLTCVGWIFFGLGPLAAEIWGLIEGILILSSNYNSPWHKDARGVELRD